jgi:vitamin K-dependent gamma-carboxylase
MRPDVTRTDAVSSEPRAAGFWCAPVDAASLAVLRIAFGAVMMWWAIDDLRLGRVRDLYVRPHFQFSYHGFEWVRPWAGHGPYWHYGVMFVLALLIAVGLFYRVCMPLFAVSFTIFFLWDRTNYQNHYVLILLLSWVMAFLPLHRAFSLDALREKPSPSPAVPVWMVWWLRFHIALPYVYGGLAKLDSDWLAGAAMREFLTINDASLFFAWAGLVFDLAIVPLLLWKRTRILAFVAVIAFHVTNHFLFNIHIFPWFMILATTVFFEPDWPRRFLLLPSVTLSINDAVPTTAVSFRHRCIAGIMLVYVIIQLLFPLRHIVYGGDVGWHELGHYFAWRMMLRSKSAVVRYYMTDPATGETWNPSIRKMLSLQQLTTFARDPEMVRDFAHFLAGEYQRETGRQAEVRALVLATYNGRKPQLLINPIADLAQEPRWAFHRPWIMPQQEPLPDQPWQRPVEEWEAVVKIPPLPQITRGPRGERLRAPQPSRTTMTAITP